MGMEPGPFNRYYFSLVIMIDELSDMLNFVDNYRSSLYEIGLYEDGHTSEESAQNFKVYTTAFYSNDEESYAETSINIYYFDAYGEVNQYGGYVEIVFKRLTEEGKAIFIYRGE